MTQTCPNILKTLWVWVLGFRVLFHLDSEGLVPWWVWLNLNLTGSVPWRGSSLDSTGSVPWRVQFNLDQTSQVPWRALFHVNSMGPVLRPGPRPGPRPELGKKPEPSQHWFQQVLTGFLPVENKDYLGHFSFCL